MDGVTTEREDRGRTRDRTFPTAVVAEERAGEGGGLLGASRVEAVAAAVTLFGCQQ